MSIKVDELPDWQFDVDEISAGVYEVVGEDINGHRITQKGTDPDQLLNLCKDKAIQLSSNSD
jgi:hypothetical protein